MNSEHNDPARTGNTAGRPADAPGPATETFVAHRNLLFTVAYEMLGSAADAEDVLQETWLRWAGVDLDAVRDRRAYLVRITTRQALSRLRTLGRRKETYVGTWLPEPLLTAPDVAEDVELAESVSMAMMLVMETLAPNERAVFVLREEFGLDYEEISEAVGRSRDAVRPQAPRQRVCRAGTCWGAVSRGASGVRRGSVRCGRRIAVIPSPQGCSAGPGILPALAESGQRGHVPLAGCGSEPRSGRPAAGGSEVARPRSAVEKVGARPRRKLGRDGPAELSATDPHGPAGTITWGEALR